MRRRVVLSPIAAADGRGRSNPRGLLRAVITAGCDRLSRAAARGVWKFRTSRGLRRFRVALQDPYAALWYSSSSPPRHARCRMWPVGKGITFGSSFGARPPRAMWARPVL